MDYENERRRLRLLMKAAHIHRPERCWPWQGTIFSMKHKDLPYGQFWWGEINGKNKTISAHRASYLIHKGEIAVGLQVLHRCNNSVCINPDHLYLGTHENNMRDRDECGRTSKGTHRYNFLRTPELTNKVKEMRACKTKISDIIT